MPSHGSAKVYYGLDFTVHQALATQLLDVRAQVLAVQTQVLAGYGRNDGKAKLAQKLVDTLDLLRGHLSHSLLTEHDQQPIARLTALYYLKEPRA